MNGYLFPPLGGFNSGYTEWDETVLTACLAVIACIFSLFLNAYFYRFQVYKSLTLIISRKKLFISLICFFSLIVAILNLKFGIYVKGGRDFSSWPSIYTNFIKWLVGYGLTGLAISVAYYLSENNPKKIGPFFLVMAIEFLVQTSSMSRVFPFSALCLILIMYRLNYFDGRWKLTLIRPFIFLIFSIVSLIVVQSLRPTVWKGDLSSPSYENTLKNSDVQITYLRDEKSFGDFLVRRWVGLESLAAVVASDKKGYDLFYGGLIESKNTSLPSYFDRIILEKDSQYKDIGIKAWYAQNLPGIIAFSYYTGSLFFVFLICSVFTIFCGFVEIMTLKVTNNPWLTGYVGFLLAYRLASFGYAVRDTYMFLFSISALIFLGFLLRSIFSTYIKNKITLS